MGKVVDARGRSCPEPVLLARQAVASRAGDTLIILVDAAVARQNVARYLENALGCKPEIKEVVPGEWELTVKL